MTREQNQEPEKQPLQKVENPWVEALKTIVLSGVLAFGIRSFVAEARYIPSGSMLPTLEINDRLIIDKVTYRFQDPQRGDIVVFMPPETASICFGDIQSPPLQRSEKPSSTPDAQQNNPKLKDAFIKRVIGLPGDTVEVRNGEVYVNDRLLREKYIKERPNYEVSTEELNIRLRLNGGKVPLNHYLVLGDNRNNSCDGHYWGYVPRENIIGRAIVRFWPLDRVGELYPIPTYPNSLSKK